MPVKDGHAFLYAIYVTCSIETAVKGSVKAIHRTQIARGHGVRTFHRQNPTEKQKMRYCSRVQTELLYVCIETKIICGGPAISKDISTQQGGKRMAGNRQVESEIQYSSPIGDCVSRQFYRREGQPEKKESKPGRGRQNKEA